MVGDGAGEWFGMKAESVQGILVRCIFTWAKKKPHLICIKRSLSKVSIAPLWGVCPVCLMIAPDKLESPTSTHFTFAIKRVC